MLVAACTGLFVSVAPASAQIQQSEQTTKIVQVITKAFFDLLPEHKFEAERAFMTDDFAEATPLSAWKKVREQFIELVGSTPQYTEHQLTYYVQDGLLAAVDFSGQAAKPDTYVCGFVLWEFLEPNKIRFVRFEQNIVSGSVFKSMPVQEAAQLMADWHCPTSLIETVLEVSVH